VKPARSKRCKSTTVKESATRTDPESCAGTRERNGEASVGERIGQPLSPEDLSNPAFRQNIRWHALTGISDRERNKIAFKAEVCASELDITIRPITKYFVTRVTSIECRPRKHEAEPLVQFRPVSQRVAAHRRLEAVGVGGL
jgi:hypothetical protein